MKPLARPDSPRLVLCFDFDGTLHDPAAVPPVVDELFVCLQRLREERGAVWGINTGRAMNHVVEGLVESHFPFSPDWVVAREREIWYPNAVGRWVPDEGWNRQCEKDHRKFFKKIAKLLKRIRAEVEEHTGATWVEHDGDPAGLVSRTEEEMEWIVRRVVEMAADEPLLGWQRNSVYLRFGHRQYHKGSSLRKVAEGLGLGPAECFAIGDSHNDFEMLSPDAAGQVACPGNSVPEVRAHVASVGGYVCDLTHSRACVEAMEHFFPVAGGGADRG